MDRGKLVDAHRIVVKLGTHVVTHDGVELALGRIMDIVEGLARLRHAGREVLLVSSGAVGMGMRVLGLKERPRSLGLRQACAAVGPGPPDAPLHQAFAQFDVIAAQVLLTQEDLADRDRALCLRTTLMRLLELGGSRCSTKTTASASRAGRAPRAGRRRRRRGARRRSATTTGCRRGSRSAWTPICWCC